MNQHMIYSTRLQRRYTALSLPLSEAMLDALQRHQDAPQANELATPPSQDATDNACQGAWHE